MRSIVSPLDGVESPFGPRCRARQEVLALLQQFSGAAAAYSLRDLAGTDSNVVRVRRSSDNAEKDFTAKQINDGSLVVWVGAGNDGLVSVWYDQSGSGGDAAQSVATKQPKIVDAGALVAENGKFGLLFDGVDDYLQSADSSWPEFGPSTVEGWFLVETTSPSYQGFLGQWESGNSQRSYIGLKGAEFRAQISGSTFNGSSVQPNRWYHFAVSRNSGGGITFYLDGVLDGNITIASGDSILQIKTIIGDIEVYNVALNGKLSDIRIWNVEITQQKIQSIMSYGAP